MDDATGEELWTWQCGAGANTYPISYEIDGEQYIAIFAGGDWEPIGPATPYGDNLWAFKLGGTVPQAAAPAAAAEPQPHHRDPGHRRDRGATPSRSADLEQRDQRAGRHREHRGAERHGPRRHSPSPWGRR